MMTCRDSNRLNRTERNVLEQGVFGQWKGLQNDYKVSAFSHLQVCNTRFLFLILGVCAGKTPGQIPSGFRKQTLNVER